MSSGPISIILCLVSVAPLTVSFNFRDNCYVTHKGSMYNPTCDGSKVVDKNLDLNRQNTKDIYKLDLKNFNSVIFDSTVQMKEINVTNVNYVSLFLSNPSLKEVTLIGVSDLSLRYLGSEESSMENMLVENVTKLRLNSEGDAWRIKSMKLTNVKDVQMDSKKLEISAVDFDVEKSNILVAGELAVKSALARIENQTTLHFLNKGCLNITAAELTVKNCKIVLEDGVINIINSNKATFSNNDLYYFNKQSVSALGLTNVKFEDNYFSTKNMFDVLSADVKHVKHEKSQFDCNNCALNKKLLVTDLGELGDTNYCYADCTLSLNNFKRLLENNYFCNGGETTVNHTALCTVNSTEVDGLDEDIVTDIDLLRWCLLLLIPLFVLTALLCCICHRDNRKKLKEMALVNILPRELECERRQTSLPRDYHIETHYEEVDLNYSCK